jgi:hypothetical protein
MNKMVWFQNILKNCGACVKDETDALTRAFFIGVCIINKYNIIVHVQPPVLTEHDAMVRLQDPMYCKKCLYYDSHDYYCEYSGWDEL